jgi:ribosome-associated protein
MEDFVNQNEVHIKRAEEASLIAREIAERKGEKTILIDLGGVSSWTDFFLISTVNSLGHLKGLVKNVKEKLSEMDIEILHRHKRLAEDGWELIDCGYLVIHLMTREMRDFYDLERLWYEGEILFEAAEES